VGLEQWRLSRRQPTGGRRRRLSMMGEQIRANALSTESFGAGRLFGGYTELGREIGGG
jgi:hypothetical protein